MKYLRPKNWQAFQHYSDRRPTWIKFYVKLLDDREYGELKPAAMLLLHHFWLFFARLSNGGAAEPPLVANDPKWLSGKLPGRLTIAGVRSSLSELITAGFIEEFDALAKVDRADPDRASNPASKNASGSASNGASKSASKLLANFDQNASADTELDTLQFFSSHQHQIQKEDTEEERESDARAHVREASQGRGIVESHGTNRGDPEDHAAFEALKAAYPEGIYPPHDWLTAERLVRRYVRDGFSWAEILAGVGRYATQKTATGSIGTQFVKSPTRFFEAEAGKPPRFTEAFPIPASKVTPLQRAPRKTIAELEVEDVWRRHRAGEPEAHIAREVMTTVERVREILAQEEPRHAVG